MWSVRMRASKIEDSTENHISGAEGIYEYSKIQTAVRKLLERAMKHQKGFPDKIVITIERLKEDIKTISALAVNTFFSNSPHEAFAFIREKLKTLRISEKAIENAFEVIKNHPMRGAALIDSITGQRLEPDKKRGVRVSRIQMDKRRKIQILRKIKNLSQQPQRVIEALTIASKTLSYPQIVAELCVSDNPDYTTGYIASREFGYLRVTNIKNIGETVGGRVLFIKSPFDLENLIQYLERKPVLVV